MRRGEILASASFRDSSGVRSVNYKQTRRIQLLPPTSNVSNSFPKHISLHSAWSMFPQSSQCVSTVLKHELSCIQSLELDPCEDVFQDCREWVHMCSPCSYVWRCFLNICLTSLSCGLGTYTSTWEESRSCSIRTACFLTVSYSGRCWRGQSVFVMPHRGNETYKHSVWKISGGLGSWFICLYSIHSAAITVHSVLHSAHTSTSKHYLMDACLSFQGSQSPSTHSDSTDCWGKEALERWDCSTSG